MNKIILFLIFFFFSANGFAELFRFRAYEAENSAPISEINKIHEDYYGYIWIASNNGLIKFDGYRYRTYTRIKNDEFSLPHNVCSHIMEDYEHNLWVSTERGIAIYNREKDNFIHVVFKDRKEKGVLKVIQESENIFWVLTTKDILKFYNNINYAVKFDIIADDIIDCKDCIWVASKENGVTIIDKNKNTISYLEDVKGKDGTIINKHSRVLYRASNGDIYLGTTDNGFFIYDNFGNLKKHIDCNFDKENGLKSNYVLTFYEDKKHFIWIGGVNGSLSIFNPYNYCFEKIDYEIPTNISKNRFTISSILQDSHLNFWLGTHRFWLLFASSSNSMFTIFKHNNTLSNCISDNAVSSVYEDNGDLLICTDGGGLNIFKNNKFTTKLDFGYSVLDIKADNNSGYFWICTWGNGLFLYDKKNDKIIKHYTTNGKNKLPTDNLNCILVEKDYVWIGTSGKGVVWLNKKTEEIISCLNSNEDPFSINNSKFIKHLMLDKDGWLWISSSEGLRKYKDGEKQVNFKYSDKSGNLNQNQITMTFQDSKNRIWILPNSGGMYLYDEKEDSFISYENKYNLPSVLKFIEEDNDGNLWIGGLSELVRFNPETKENNHFNLCYELDNNTIYHNSSFKDHTGKIYFGSNNGLFFFNPSKFFSENKDVKVFLTNLYVFNEKQNPKESEVLNKTLECLDSIRLNYDQNYFSIEFAGIDFGNLDLFKYSYQMEGIEKDWIEIGSDRKVSFTNVSPGKYKFRVRTLASNGQYYEIEKPLVIIITPPWWNTWWFKLFFCIILVALVYFIFKIRTNNLQKQKANLESIVDARTAELQQKNEEINFQKESVEKKNKELDEILTIKNRILSIVAHDLKNPVSAISGLLSVIVSKKKDKTTQESKLLIEVNQTAQKLQSQMENILQWAKIQTKEILYNPSEFNFSYQVKEIISLLHGSAINKNISIFLDCSLTKYAYADERMVGTVVRNLLNNAIKFTNIGGRIKITISEDDEFIYCSIKDDGVGMEAEFVKSIFSDDFCQSTNGTDNEKGSGLGLKICYDFIKNNKGNITINSRAGEGTEVKFSIPIGNILPSFEKINKEMIPEPSLQNDVIEQNFNKDKSTILIIDDNKDILLLLENIFQNDYNVVSALNGKEGFEKAKELLPNMIISDIMMPIMDGRQLCASLKKDSLTKHIPIILLTSEDSKDCLIESLNLGADDYISKPFENEVLYAKVGAILMNRELQLAHIRTEILSKADVSSMALPETKDDAFLKKFIEIVQSNISDSNFSIETLAQQAALSRVQLFRKLKALTGCTPSEYVKNCRLEYASKMLKTGKYSVADVAYESGFSDPKYFGLCFTDKYGISPSQYAKENKRE